MGGPSPFCALGLVCLCELHPKCTRIDVILNEPFLSTGRVKNLNLHEFRSGDRRVQSRNDPKKALKAGVFPLLAGVNPLV